MSDKSKADAIYELFQTEGWQILRDEARRLRENAIQELMLTSFTEHQGRAIELQKLVQAIDWFIEKLPQQLIEKAKENAG